jgi:NADH:ubiquinone oxidoreductase subunit 3 (subunit A)
MLLLLLLVVGVVYRRKREFIRWKRFYLV